MSQRQSWISRLSHLGTLLHTALGGVLVGSDRFGNRYYRERRPPDGRREKRWVIYPGEPEASEVPPEWHGWLHYTLADPLPEGASKYHKAWQRDHQPNATGTAAAYRPPGHPLAGGVRARATGDYQPWRPE